MLCLALLSVGLSPPAAVGQPASFGELHGLPRTQALEGRSFHVTGIVLCYDADWNQLYVQSGGSEEYLNPAGIHAALTPGRRVEITGTTAWAGDHPALTNIVLKQLDASPLPEPRRVELARLAQSTDVWIQTEGEVRVAETSKGRLGLLLRSGEAACIAYVMGPPGTNDWSSLVGSTVAVTGIVTRPTADRIILIVPSRDQLALSLGSNVSRQQETTQDLRPETQNSSLAKVPVNSVEALLGRSLGVWTNNRVRVQGSVVVARPEDYLVVKDPTGSIRARIMQAIVPPAGTRVNVWGFLRELPEEPILDDAYFEEVRSVSSSSSLLSSSIESQARERGGGRELTRVKEVTRLSVAEAALRPWVRLQGAVTYADASWSTAFVQDHAYAVYFELRQADVHPGDWVEIRGRACPGQFAPVVSNATVRVLGHTNLPAPVIAEFQDLADGHLDARRIELEGLVQRLAVEQGHLRLGLVSRQGRFNAVIPGFEQDPPPIQLLDARVRMRGVYGAEMNLRHQLSGVLLHVPSLDEVAVLEPAPVNPFALAVTPIGSVVTFDPSRQTGHRLKLRGVVTMNLPGQGLYLQDESGGIHVETMEAEPVAAGDLVEVLGFPALGEFSPRLEQGLVRKLGRGTWPAAVRTSAERILMSGTNDAALIQLEATLLQEVPDSARPQLFLRDGAVVFTAQVASRAQAHQAAGFRPGSLLRLTGICSIQGTDRHEPQGLRLLLAGPGSLKVLRVPPAWTGRHTAAVAGGALLLAMLVLGWVMVLRRQVRSRTRALAYERDLLSVLLENLPDAVYFKDRESRFLRFSKFFNRLFNVADPAEVQGRTDFDFFTEEHARPAFEDEQQIMRTGVPIIGKVEKETHKDGRVSWCLTSKIPWRDNQGQVIGTFGVSKDITALKEAELEVERIHKQLLEASRRAGMADVATSVLHNVGNVLNSINVSTSLLVQHTRQSKAAELSRVVDLLARHSADLGEFLTSDPKGRQVPRYLEELAAHLVGEKGRLMEELLSLTKHVEHVNTIIAMQQSYAGVAGVLETVPAAELVEDALRFNGEALARHGVGIVRQYGPRVPPVTVDKHKVLQILVNLVSNAKYACDEFGSLDRRLTVSVYSGQGKVKIAVEDNGVGIAPENLTRIFNHGFTTRKNGHGFGLHSAALAADELGGSLTAFSPGPGKGATFTLELPISLESKVLSRPRARCPDQYEDERA